MTWLFPVSFSLIEYDPRWRRGADRKELRRMLSRSARKAFMTLISHKPQARRYMSTTSVQKTPARVLGRLVNVNVVLPTLLEEAVSEISSEDAP